MASWSLYRHDNGDGTSKDWAVRTNPDGSISTRWGKTATRLLGLSTRKGISQDDILRSKRNKGYVFIGEVDIDDSGHVRFPGQTPVSAIPPAKPQVKTVYWNLKLRRANQRSIRFQLSQQVQSLIGRIRKLGAIDTVQETPWPGWQALAELTESTDLRLSEVSGQIKPEHGVEPLLFLLALKKLELQGLEVGIATENSRVVSADLKAETEVLECFGADLDSVRPLAEALGLLKPRLNLAEALFDAEDRWF